MDERDVVLSREGRKLAAVGARHKPGDLEIACVHAEDRAGLLADRARVVAGVGAIRRTDLDELRAGAPEHVRDAEAAADLDQLATRHDDLLARGERREGEQDGCRVVIDHDRVFGGREVGQEAGGVTVTFAAFSGDEVVLDADGAGGGSDRGERPV